MDNIGNRFRLFAIDLSRIIKKVMRPDWITSIATVVLVVITAIYVVLTYTTLQETRRQVALTQDPIVRILPEEDVKGEIAKFTLEIVNTGIADVSDVRIYADYFVSLTAPQGPITLNRFGMMVLKPDIHISSLKRGEKSSFNLEFRDVHKRMAEFYTSDIKGHRMMLVRLLFKYRRVEDGKEFKSSKAYTIAGHGDMLIDYDERGISSPTGPSFSQIKQILGVSEK